MNLYKQYFSAFVSVICIFFYFTPWLIGANRANLGLYIISFLWFLVAWIIVIIKLVGIMKSAKKKKFSKHMLYSLLIMILCYTILFWGWTNHYIITV